MTDTGALEGQLPGDPDELAEILLSARARFLESQAHMRDIDRGEELLRAQGRDPAELAEEREQMDAIAGRCLEIERAVKARLLRIGGTAAIAGELTPRLARHVLVAANADGAVLANFDDHPEKMTRNIAALITDPLPLETKLAMIAELDDGTAGNAPA